MTWQVNQVVAADLQHVLEAVSGDREVLDILLVAPMLRDTRGATLADAIFAVVSRPREGATAPAEPSEVSEVVQAPPDELAGLPVSLRGILDANGVTTRAELAATWKGLFMQDAFGLPDAVAIQALLENGDGAETGQPALRTPPAPAAPSPPPPPAPRRQAFNPPPTPSGLILLPGMENLRQVPRGYERQHAELPPELRSAAVLEGKPNVFHQDAVILPKKRMDGERDGVTEPGEVV